MKCHERLNYTAANKYEYCLCILTSVADPSLQTIDLGRSDKYELVSYIPNLRLLQIFSPNTSHF